MTFVHETPIPDHVRSKVQLFLPGIKHARRKGMICPAGGLAAAVAKSLLESDVQIAAMLDNNAVKHGTSVAGLPVLPLSAIEIDPPDFVMVASVSFRDEIIAQLRPLSTRFGFQLLDLCDLPAGSPDAVLRQVCNRLDKMYAIDCEDRIQQILSSAKYGDPLRLERYGYCCYSQQDEDGIIQEIVRRIGDVPRTFVEFGVGDGLENNTLLLLKQGWNGLWIDASAENAAAIRNRFQTQIHEGSLSFLERMITRENINDLIGERFEGEIGLLSIDVDGNDYYVWDAISIVSPRIVVIEYNAKFPPPIKWSISYDPEHVWDFSDYQGASLAALAELGFRKNYQIVGCNVSGSNAFFVRRNFLNGRFLENPDPMVYYQPPRYYLMEGFKQMSGHRPDPRSGWFF